MDASASLKDDGLKEVIGLFLKIEKTEFPVTARANNTIIKYTKLPGFGINDQEFQNTATKEPKFRRLITIENSNSKSPRSLKSDAFIPQKLMTNKVSSRKIIAITEDEEHDLHPRFSRERKTNSVKTSSRSVEANLIEKNSAKQTQRSTHRYTPSKYSKENKPTPKSQLFDANEAPKTQVRRQVKSVSGNIKTKNVVENVKPKSVTGKDNLNIRQRNLPMSKCNVSRNYSPSKYDKITLENKKMVKERVKTVSYTGIKERSIDVSKHKIQTKDFMKKCPIPVIFVPLEESKKLDKEESELSNQVCKYVSDQCISTDNFGFDADVNTDPPPEKIDKFTDTLIEPQLYLSCVHTDVQTEELKQTYESLNIPNVTLTKDKSEIEENSLRSVSLPNLKIPMLKITSNKNENSYIESNCQSGSYIISRATLTYTTKQKINFEAVGSNENVSSNKMPSPLSYPMSIVSVFKKEIHNKDVNKNKTNADINNDKSEKQLKNCINELKSLDCSYASNSNKLMKPSDVISTIRVNNGLLQSDHFCEQFQRELNFIDSFFESLQYLENCSFTDTCFRQEQVDRLVQNPSILNTNFDLKITEYNKLLTKLENGDPNSDTETMASKNLFLLNRLIRNEQRRAKNLLFVLKRREEALKDFTKSQILYLENKKKKDNIDISALKKKQRGALLKLQHECGEMQRMRKALLTLSEKRKVALLKTKTDLELKLKNNVDVEQILLGKKKVKRNTGSDRTAPLKCFDLSSSGCEDSATSRHGPDVLRTETQSKSMWSAEKSIQTGDSILAPTLVSELIDTTDENFVIVDGGYLNILFHNLSLPQIFSGGKQYEVNQEALKNIINTSNNQHSFDSYDKLMDQLKNNDLDKSTTPSTARSLVEEFDQYYKSLKDEDKLSLDHENESVVYEISDVYVQTSVSSLETSQNSCCEINLGMSGVEAGMFDLVEYKKDLDSPTGPLPVPAGAADVSDPPAVSLSYMVSKTSSSNTIASETSVGSINDIVSSIASLSPPAQHEAEELRRQQLAIEKEIKELEQQQCRLLVVREIPDKPPPPYTPPIEAKTETLPKKFIKDNIDIDKIQCYVTDPSSAPISNDGFDVFVNDFCKETLHRYKPVESDKPWDACNLLPPKPPVDIQKLVKRTNDDLEEVLSGVPSTHLFGVSSRRSDHIDDILFAEWRRVEPEWTSLHADEAIVKNQIFESIFQRILTETVDEYKRTLNYSEN